MRAQLQALQTITRRLESDLSHNLKQTAPKIIIGPPSYQSRISSDGQLWLAFAKLDASCSRRARGIPNACYATSRTRGPVPKRPAAASPCWSGCRRGVNPARCPKRSATARPSNASRVSEVKLRPGDFNFSLAPEADVGFLDRSLHIITEGTPRTAIRRVRLENPNGTRHPHQRRSN